MLESLPRSCLVSLVLVAALAAPTALASLPVDRSALDEASDGAHDALGTVGEALPSTGTWADAIVDGMLGPGADPTDTNAVREKAAENAPATGTPADDPVHDALTPEGDPKPDTGLLAKTASDGARAAADAARQVRDIADSDPLQVVNDQVDPVARTATAALPDADAYEVTEATPASGDAVAVAPGAAPLMVAGASAAEAAVLVAFWLAGSSGSLGAAGATTAGSEMRRLLPFASPLFTRFEKDTVLGHPKREALYAAILQDPGVSLQALCDASGLSRTAATHHLRLLEMQHLIVSKRVGRSRHYYENGGRFGRDQKEAYAVLHNARSKDVARFVRDNPGAIQKALCSALGIQPSIAHWHLRRLQEAQLVEAVRQGRTVSYYPGVALKSLDRPSIPAPEPQPVAAPMLRALPA